MKDLKKEARRQDRLERLGTNQPACAICGETDDRCLELHHVAGRKHDDAVVPVCRNCHRKLSDDQKDHPEPAPVRSQSESIGHFLLGLADLFSLLVDDPSAPAIPG